MKDAYVTVGDFFDGADEMRRAFDAHFVDPYTHNDEHQVWNYWHVPDLYTYMRTNPSKVVPREMVERFQERLNRWALKTLGLMSPFDPWMSLYVNGCGQGIHNDSRNGQMGFVFSLTNWETRKFLGGIRCCEAFR